MTIDIATPDGSSFSFPDGTTHEVIKGALDKHYGVAKPAPITLENIGRSFARGVPVVGGLADKGNAALYAALQPAYESLLPSVAKGDTTISHKPSFGERYTENLALENVKDLSYAKDHPTANMVGELAGGIGSAAAAAPTAIGARVLGLNGTTLPGAMWRGVASGTGIGAADALTRGQDPIAAGTLGGAIGGAAPVVGRVVSTIAAPVATAIRGLRDPAAEASRRVAGAVQRDIASGTAGLTEPEMLAAQHAGHPVNLMDMGGETTRAVARSAANTSPEGRAILNRGIDDRFENQSNRITGWLNRTFHYPDAEAQQRAIVEAAQSANRPAYRQAIQDSHAQNVRLWDPDFEHLAQAPEVQNAIRLATPQLRNWAVRDGFRPPVGAFEINNGRTTLRQTNAGNDILPGLQYWDYVKRALDEMNTPTSRAFSRALREKLDTAVPAYREARAGAATFFRASDALEAGQNFVTQNFANPEARLALQRMSQQERQLFQDGFVSRFMESINQSGDRRNILNTIAHSPAHREKLNIALGPQRARELEGILHVEQIMDRGRGAVQGNSTTARQLTELGLAGGASALESGSPIPTDPAALMSAALVYGAARGRHVIDTRVARQVAELLASNDPQRLRTGMQLLTHNSNIFGALRHGDAALASIAARGSQPALTQ